MRFRVPVLALEGSPTDDGRTFESLDWRDTPLTLYAQLENTHGHDGAGIAGSIDEIAKESDGTLTAIIDTDDDGQVGRESARLIQAEDLRGISVDLAISESDVEFVEEPDEDGFPQVVGIKFGKATIIAATLTGMPAFGEANQIDPTPLDAPAKPDDGGATSDEFTADHETAAVETAEVTGQVDLPVADRDTDWDASAAESNMLDLCATEGGDVDPSCMSRGFMWRDPNEEGDAAAHYSLPYCDVINGQLQIVPNGVIAAAAAMEGARGGVEGIPDDDRAAIETRICSLYDRINEVLGLEDDDRLTCPSGEDADSSADGEELVAATDRGPRVLVASAAGPDVDPAWFDDPELDGPTPFTVTDDGRVYGHLALWGSCHIGFDGACVTPPASQAGYAYFRVGEVQCADGCSIPTGVITMDTDHASLSVSADEAWRYYADTGYAAADVAVGEDAHGIWVAGAVRPSTLEDPERMRYLRGAALSGDWRRIGGNLEMVGALAVNVPAFPVPRGLAASAGRFRVEDGVQTALVASGIVRQRQRSDTPVDEAVAAAVRRELDRREQIAALDADLAPAREAVLARLDGDVRSRP